ncbi:K(+)-transporting ATPase subunit F [Raoultella planticola]|nr:K(+)-transporting ATPase subunit F [Raoultella planticola]
MLRVNRKTPGGGFVSAGVIAGVALVFLLLAYLVYALINAEAF